MVGQTWHGFNWTAPMHLGSCRRLQKNSPHMLSFETPRLTQPTRAITRNDKGEVVESTVTPGFGQKDPFSPLAFATTLPIGDMLREILERQPNGSEIKINDGLVQLHGRPDPRSTRHIAKERLGQVGLRLNSTKCRVFTLPKTPPQGDGGLEGTRKRRWNPHCQTALLRGERRNGA